MKLKCWLLLQVDMLLPGFVKKIMNYGVFVEFANDVFGLAPNAVSNAFSLPGIVKSFIFGRSCLRWWYFVTEEALFVLAIIQTLLNVREIIDNAQFFRPW